MRPSHAFAHFEAASREAVARLERDRAAASPPVRSLLAHLALHLFDPALNVESLKRACGVRDHRVPLLFRDEVGEPPGKYIWRLRMETAARLLRSSGLEVTEIAAWVGCPSLQTFSRAFLRWSGKRPNAYREGARESIEAADEARDEGLLTPDNLRRALLGTVPEEDAGRMIRYLEDVYSTDRESRTASAPSRLAREHQEVDRAVAEAVWRQIREAPFPEQLEVVRHRLRLATPAMFELLRVKSREEGRDDRRWGVRVAELGLESLVAMEGVVGEVELANLRARAWAWVANARRLAMDFLGAEKALIEADRWLPERGRELLALAETLQIRAALRWYQCRFDEAITIQTRVVPLFELLRDPEPLVQSLVLHAEIDDCLGRFDRCVRCLTRAASLLDSSRGYAWLTVRLSMAFALVRSERAEGAESIVEELSPIFREWEHKRGAYHLLWLKGLIRRQRGDTIAAERLLLRSKSGFTSLSEHGHAALVAVDLAMLYADIGRPGATTSLAMEILPYLEATQLKDEALVTLGLLKNALESGEVSCALLARARGLVAPAAGR